MTNWQTKKLGDIGTFFKGSGIPKDSARSGDLPAVRYGELYTSFDIFINQVRSSIDQSTAMSAAKILKGDILFAGSGETVEEIGKSAVYQLDQEGYAGGDIVIMRPGSDQDSRFLGQALNSDEARKQLRKFGQGQSVVHVYRKDLEKLELLLPEKPEQERIVGVLEVWDEYIEKLEQKIALKEQLKKGLMQQLLTGKRRLPGFNDEWHDTRLGDIAKMQSGGTPSSKNDEFYGNDIIWVSIADMTSSGKYISDSQRKLSKLGYESSTARLYPANTVLYAMYASIGECVIASVPLSSSQAILGIQPSDKLDNEFLYYYLISKKDAVKLLGQQGTQSNLNAGIVKDFVVNLPTIQEQRAVSAVISKSDDEINLFKDKLSTVKLQKKYLLKNLITGAIRTPEDLQPLDTSRLERSTQ